MGDGLYFVSVNFVGIQFNVLLMNGVVFRMLIVMMVGGVLYIFVMFEVVFGSVMGSKLGGFVSVLLVVFIKY